MLPDPRDRPWLTVAELAEITGEGEKVLRAAIEAGQIPSVRVGRYIRIPTARLMIEVLGINGTTADGLAVAEPVTLGGDTK
jgi:excisionase family DNA binding protein